MGRACPDPRSRQDGELIEQILTFHGTNRGGYGAPRIHAELRMAHGAASGAKHRALMRQARISGMVRRKRGRTTISVPGVRVADDLVERRFRPGGPNQLYVGHHLPQAWEGWLY